MTNNWLLNKHELTVIANSIAVKQLSDSEKHINVINGFIINWLVGALCWVYGENNNKLKSVSLPNNQYTLNYNTLL